MAYTNSRFRTKTLTLDDTIDPDMDGLLISPKIFGDDFDVDTPFRFRSIILNALTVGSKLYIKGDVDDDWVDITTKLAGQAQFTFDFVNEFYLKSDDDSATIGLIVSIADSRQ